MTTKIVTSNANSKRQQRHKAKQKSDGLRQLSMWVPDDQFEQLKIAINGLVANRGLEICLRDKKTKRVDGKII